MSLVGNQGGYSVTWGSVTTDFDGGHGYVIINYYDGTCLRFDDDEICDLAGMTYNNVVVIDFDLQHGHNVVSQFSGTITGNIADHVYEGQAIGTTGNTFYGVHFARGSLTLGADIEIVSFSISAQD